MATTKVRGELVDLNESTSESGLKIPTGTQLNRPATDVAGMVRNNTNETSDSSASCEEYYNGTAWQKINNVALPVYRSTVLYTGNSTNDFSTSLEQSITGVGFKPDLVWIKQRNDNYSNGLFDSTRGGTFQIQSNNDSAQNSSAGYLKTFDSDGFGLGGDFAFNRNTYTYVAWCWQANGGTTSSNTDGSSTSTVQVNSGAGFSIVKYVGNQTAGHTIGHGLGATPQVIIIKCLDTVRPWYVYHVGVDATNPADYNLRLNATDARQDSTTEFNDTEPTSTVFTLGTASGPNGTGDDYIAYCFTPIAGYSKFGSYAGSASNVDVVTGFQPSFVLVKSTSVEDWNIMDSARGGSERLFPNDNRAESTTTNACIFNADGFTIGVTGNASLNNAGDNYIYMAFK